MATSSSHSDEDPLVAALPPATDYLTYLTLLEYQLNPDNLSTLNRLLASDDGTLAEEIGWDLLKLVLPMLQEAPQEATACLEIVARRGNPREVVVRVAEELERLGRDQNDDTGSEFLGLDDDDLPTFAGEGARIHLGNMKLDGMPDSDHVGRDASDQNEAKGFEIDAEVPVQDESAKLQVLLLMLGILHPRIQTQYPSRFLATSLPASLGAYRRVSVSAASTMSFLDLLGKLSGKQRPALPPRTPSAIQDGSSNVPLPDPEAAAEAAEGVTLPSDNEKAIILRLLQAVMLEVFDEYMSSLQTQEISTMSWTSRLRERMEPQRVIPHRKTEANLWESSNYLRERDNLTHKILLLTDELKLDAAKELHQIIEAGGVQDDAILSENVEEEVSEYPTSPSQIPFPLTGLTMLFAAVKYQSRENEGPMPLSVTTSIIQSLIPLSKSPILPSPAMQDAALSILYTNINALSSQFDSTRFIHLLSTLTQLFTITPEPYLRDNAHHIVTKLLHAYPDRQVRLVIIKQTIQCAAPGAGADAELVPLAPPFNEGALKAVGVDWLKDEFLSHLKNSRRGNSSSQPLQDETGGLDPTLLTTDKILHELLFALIPPAPLPARSLSSINTAASTTTATTAASIANPNTTNAILLSLPFYISTLNLLSILLSPNTSTTTSTTQSTLPTAAGAHLSVLEGWRDYLLSVLLHSSPEEANGEAEEIKASGPDIFALDDACRRTRALL